MSSLIYNSPAAILAQYLIDEGLLADPTGSSAWPVYVGYLPDTSDVPDNCAVIYDTIGLKDGRLMTGDVVLHPGAQVAVRSSDHEDGWTKASSIEETLAVVEEADAVVISITDTGGTSTYPLLNASQGNAVIAMGVEEGTKRRSLFTINYLLTFGEETRT